MICELCAAPACGNRPVAGRSQHVFRPNATSGEYFSMPRVHKCIVKTILVILVSLTIGLFVPSLAWGHGGGSGGSGSGSGGGGGSGSGGGGAGGGGSGGAGGGAGSGSSSSAGGGAGGDSGNSAGGGSNGGGIGQGQGHGAAHAGDNGMAHGRGNATGHGGGFGFGHGVGNPGHNALSTRSSHSQNTSRKGGTHDGRSFSNHTRSMHSLAENHTPHSRKGDQVAQVDDKNPGEKKGLVESLPLVQQADRDTPLNPETIHSDPDDVVTKGQRPGLELNLDRDETVNPETIQSDLNEIMTQGLPHGLELNPDRHAALNLETIHSNLDDIVTKGLPRDLELNLDRGKSLPVNWQAKVAWGTIVPDTDDTPATALPHHWELRDGRAMLRSTIPDLGDDDDKWKSVPYFGALLLFFSWILQNWTRRATKALAP
jgi:hypothetical protein